MLYHQGLRDSVCCAPTKRFREDTHLKEGSWNVLCSQPTRTVPETDSESPSLVRVSILDLSPLLSLLPHSPQQRVGKISSIRWPLRRLSYLERKEMGTPNMRHPLFEPPSPDRPPSLLNAICELWRSRISPPRVPFYCLGLVKLESGCSCTKRRACQA